MSVALHLVLNGSKKIQEQLFLHVRMTELSINDVPCLINDDATSLVPEKDS
jgi:hypothetical protein